jgi:hypothetical protein
MLTGTLVVAPVIGIVIRNAALLFVPVAVLIVYLVGAFVWALRNPHHFEASSEYRPRTCEALLKLESLHAHDVSRIACAVIDPGGTRWTVEVKALHSRQKIRAGAVGDLTYPTSFAAPALWGGVFRVEWSGRSNKHSRPVRIARSSFTVPV